MNKIIVCLLLLYTFVSSAHSQTRYGAKISYGVLTPRNEIVQVGDENEFVIHEVRYFAADPVFSFGGFHMTTFNYLFLQTDLMLSRHTLRFEVSSIEEGMLVKERSAEKWNFIDFQIIAGVTQNNFRLGVGPLFHVVTGYQDALDNVYSYQNKRRGLNTSFSGLIGYDYNQFSFELKYQGALRTIGDHIYWGPYRSRFRQTPDVISFAVGVSF
jgi:hypothetical protein